MVNILVKYLKINDLEELTREGDAEKIFRGECGREGAAPTAYKFSISNFTSKPVGFFSLC
jgi:hypothetical protein